MRLIALFGCLAVAGCSTVHHVGPAPAISSKDCTVDVYTSYQAAIANGPIKELCVIAGTSSGSFSHTPQTAIEKHKHKACQCGATMVYIQSVSPMSFSVAQVSMMAFKYIEE